MLNHGSVKVHHSSEAIKETTKVCLKCANVTSVFIPVFVLQHHSYKVKTNNALKKCEVSVRQLHNVNTKFVLVLHAQLIERLGEKIPNNLTFEVGYYEGSQYSKIWLYSKDDLDTMYEKYPKGEITLWCSSCARTGIVESCNRQREYN